jgi:hypothetical protein
MAGVLVKTGTDEPVVGGGFVGVVVERVLLPPQAVRNRQMDVRSTNWRRGKVIHPFRGGRPVLDAGALEPSAGGSSAGVPIVKAAVARLHPGDELNGILP